MEKGHHNKARDYYGRPGIITGGIAGAAPGAVCQGRSQVATTRGYGVRSN